jgi:hypothetical protein
MGNKQRFTWRPALVVCAILLLLPGVYTSGIAGPSTEDADLAFTPVARLPLDSLKRTGAASLIFGVPSSDQWARIRDGWGDPGYIVFAFAERDSSSVLSWSSLGVEVTASTGRGPLGVEAAEQVPYAYSSRAQDPGLVFRPQPGEKVRLDITVRNPSALPDGELVVQANWNSSAINRAVGIAFNVDVRRYVKWCSICGVVLLMAAALIRTQQTA